MSSEFTRGDVVELLTRAAADLASIAPAVALELYEQALASIGPENPRRLDIEVACLEPLARAGGIDEARRRAEVLLARFHEARDRGLIHAALGAVLATAGDLSTSTTHYRAALRPVDRSPAAIDATGAATSCDPNNAVRQCLADSQRVLLGDDPDVIASLLEKTLDGTDDPHVECVAHQGLALAAGALGRYDIAYEHALESFRLMDTRSMPRDGFLIPDVWIGSFDAFRDRFATALKVFDRVGYEAERRGELATLVHTSTALGLVAFFAGRWDDAIREFGIALAMAAETGANAHLVAAHATLAAIGVERGPIADARTHLTSGEEALQVGSHLFGVDLLVWVRATVEADDGNTDEAIRQLLEFWRLTSSMRGLTQFRMIAPSLVRYAVAAGDRALAMEVTAEVERLAERTIVASSTAAAVRCRALCDNDPDGLVAAAGLLRSGPWRVEYARTCEDAAQALAAFDRSDAAREIAASAVNEYAAMEASVAVQRLASTVGSTAPSPQSSQSSRASFDTLSPREAEVVDLVKEGLANPDIAGRLFISRRTVESHVAGAMQKLGATNRTKLAMIAAAQSPSSGKGVS